MPSAAAGKIDDILDKRLKPAGGKFDLRGVIARRLDPLGVAQGWLWPKKRVGGVRTS